MDSILALILDTNDKKFKNKLIHPLSSLLFPTYMFSLLNFVLEHLQNSWQALFACSYLNLRDWRGEGKLCVYDIIYQHCISWYGATVRMAPWGNTRQCLRFLLVSRSNTLKKNLSASHEVYNWVFTFFWWGRGMMISTFSIIQIFIWFLCFLGNLKLYMASNIQAFS